MWLSSLLTPSPRARSKPRRRAATRSRRPILEELELRLVPTTQTFNPGDTAALLQDLQAASNNPTVTTILNLQAGVAYVLKDVNNFWYGPDGLPPIDSPVIIHGNGATIQRGSNNFRLFYVSGGMELPAGSLTMDNLTLKEGLAIGGSSNQGGGGLGAGGAIFNQGTLLLTGVTLSDNVALGGSHGVTSAGNGGGGMGQDAPAPGEGGGFGGSLGGTFGGLGGNGGGGGFLKGADGNAGSGGGLGGFSSNGISDGGDSSGGFGGNFGDGGGLAGGGGGGGGGGDNITLGGDGGDGGFGGGGGDGDGSNALGGEGGFGGGGGGNANLGGGFGGFGGGGGNGAGGGGAGLGGAIFNMGADSADAGSGQATLVNCTLTDNSAQGGNGGPDQGVATGGAGFGGAIFNLDGTATLINDTLVANTVAGGGTGADTGGADGGAVYNLALGNDIDTGNSVTAALVLNNSILATSSTGKDLVSNAVNRGGHNAATVSGNHNLVMTSSGSIDSGVITVTANPNLGPLQSNGGPTQTLLPASGSPVLRAGDPSLAPPTDQRGQPRPPSGPADLGSVQVSLAITATTITSNPTITFSAGDQNVTLTAQVISNGGPVNEGTVTFTVEQHGTVIGTATTSDTVGNGQASVSYVLPGGTASGTYTITASYSDSQGKIFLPSTSVPGSLIVNPATTTGGGSTGGGSSGSTAPTSAGLFGLVLEGFDLTLDSLLASDYAMIGVQNDLLDAIIDQLQAAINGDQLFNTFAGQMAVLLGEANALNNLGRS